MARRRSGIGWLTGALAVAFAAAVALVLSRPEVLIVERVEIVGHARAAEPALRHLADVRSGTRLWSVDPARVAAGVRRHPWVSAVRASREVGGTVRVEVEEHEPVALMVWGERLLYVDRGGWPFAEVRGETLDLPILLGLGPEIEARDWQIPRLVIRDALWLIDTLEARHLIAREAISDITFDWHRGLTVRTTAGSGGPSASEVQFGFDGYERQIRRLANLMEQGVDLRDGLSVDLAPSSVAVVRPLANSDATGEGGPSQPDRRARDE